MQIPSSFDIAEKLIKDNPEHFTGKLGTRLLIVNAIEEYYHKCREYINQDQERFEGIKDTLKNLTNDLND